LKAHLFGTSLGKIVAREVAEAALRDGFSEAMLAYACNKAVVITAR
jgi:surfactin synthase thioesterase subunit